MFEHYQVNILAGHKLTAVKDDRIVLRSGNTESELEVDSVVVAVGFK